jgi:PKD repeat protein
MKVHLLTFALILSGSVVFAQSATNENAALHKELAPVQQQSTNSLRQQQVATCGPDSIVYPYLKELVFASPNDSFFVDAMVGAVRTASQGYQITDNINILGVQFWGAAYSTSPAPQTLLVRAYLYSVDASNMPVAILDSADVLITQAYDFYEAMFAVPHANSQNFAVGVRSVLNDTLAVITNNAGNVWTPDYSESLGWRRFGSGVWNSTLSFFGQDLEYMIFPIVDYSITTSFNMVNDTACMNDPLVFTNLSSSIFGNRFLNLYAFDAFWGFAVADSSFNWNYGDNATWTSSYNGAHTYSTSGAYDVTLAGELIGYYTSCSDTFTMNLEIMPQVTAGFTYDNTAEPTVAFMDASTGAASYSWDFGDSSGSTSMNPSHTYAAIGTYTVTLVTTGFCGTDTTTQVITITTTGIQNGEGSQPSVFFTAADQSLNITLPASKDARIEVYGLAGDLVYAENTVNSTNKKISMNEMGAGVYFIRIEIGGEISTVKFVVTK